MRANLLRHILTLLSGDLARNLLALLIVDIITIAISNVDNVVEEDNFLVLTRMRKIIVSVDKDEDDNCQC